MNIYIAFKGQKTLLFNSHFRYYMIFIKKYNKFILILMLSIITIHALMMHVLLTPPSIFVSDNSDTNLVNNDVTVLLTAFK